MPVKPENKARYPADWGAIAEAVKAEAGWRCEQCGVGPWRSDLAGHGCRAPGVPAAFRS